MKLTTPLAIVISVLAICVTAIICSLINANASRYQSIENLHILDKSTGSVFSPNGGVNFKGRVREFGK